MALQRSKVTNLRLAAARLAGLTLKPGETLSFWRAVGKPTRRRGYVEGMILRNGRVASGILECFSKQDSPHNRVCHNMK